MSREEIREGIARVICCFANGDAESKPASKSCAECEYNTPDSPFPDCFHDIRRDIEGILTYLHSQDVMIKVKCPDCCWGQFYEETVSMTPCYSCNSTGYRIEPLIEE